MTYSNGEGLIAGRIRDHANFDSDNCVQGDWLALNSGKSDHYAILRPGPAEYEFIAFTTYMPTYVTIVELWQQYTDEATTRSNLQTHLNDLASVLMNEPRLSDSTNTIINSEISRTEQPQAMWRRDNGAPAWYKWDLYVEWQEENTVTIS